MTPLRSRTIRLRAVPIVALALALFATASPAAQAQETVHVLTSFDESAGQTPEGITVDRMGNTYVSVSPLGDLWKIPAGSSEPMPFGHVDGITPGTDFGMLGLAVDSFGNAYAAVQSANADAAGVWRFDRATGHATRLPGSEAIGLPNGLAFDRQMNLFVTDSVTGAIWRIPWGGSASVWLQDEALTGDGSLGLGLPLGANGIAVRKGAITVTNTERRTILQIPKEGGEPGEIDLVTTLPAGDNPDGVALDVGGNAFVAMNLANAIAEVSPAGSMDVVASGDPLDFPSSVVFGSGRAGRTRLYGVSFSIGETFGQPPGDGPSVFWIEVGTPGWPVP
jgi:sugar lactone lactonase YvrE